MSNPAPAAERAVIKTSYGEMEIAFWPDVAPKTVENFKKLAREGFYNGTAFHRIIKGFMIQGGCPNTKAGSTGMPGTGGPGYNFADEFHPTLRHDRPGLLSMANRGPNTNGGQFFITLVPTPWLDGKHTIFGEVIEGLDVLKKLEAAGSQSGATSEPLKMTKVTVEVK
mgnify:CR=1 FL=1